MAQIPLSKSQLSREKDSLALYRRYLPALDLKRQQLMAERAKAQRMQAEYDGAVLRAEQEAGAALPMLAEQRIRLDALVRLAALRLGTENVAGVQVPTIEALDIEVAPYGRMTRPHWVDETVRRLTDAIRLRVESQIAERRAALLARAATRITQRTNLFEKILIPQAERNIRRILIAIGDTERAAVVAAKLSKRKRAAEGPETRP